MRIRDTSDDSAFDVTMFDAEKEPEVNEENKESHVPQICYLLLKYGVSTKFYHELSMEISELPRSHLVIIHSYITLTIAS